jgi:Peptidase family S41
MMGTPLDAAAGDEKPRSADGGLAAEFLAAVAEPAREHLTTSITLREFMRRPGALTLEDRRLLVEQAILLLEQNYVHLPLKIALHGVNPLQRLRLLAIRLERQTAQTADSEPVFNAMLSEIFNSVRDLHTNYSLPQPYAGKIAFLPFRIEEYYDEARKCHYIVTAVADGFNAEGFGPGAEITHWAGVPIDRAVEMHAARFAGGNAAARHARGVESLTLRPLVSHLPPDEEWVVVTYRSTGGSVHELRHEWLVVDNLPPSLEDESALTTAAASMGVDVETDAANRAKTLLFAPGVLGQLRAGTDPIGTVDEGVGGVTTDDGDLATRMPGVFRARTVSTAFGVFGHIRIFTFAVRDPEAFVGEFVRLIRMLPQTGLIVDVRDNGGGHIHASEFTLQTLTPRQITPAPVQFVSSPLNLRICRKHQNPAGQINLNPWVSSLEQAREIGASFSAATAMTPQDGVNAIGQQYHGPVVLVINARCYSATDIFAAGFADHQIGPILGTDSNTGAGGANVWPHSLLKALLDADPADSASPYRSLPKGASMRVAIRRTLRVGEQSGTPLEDLGVQPDHVHLMTARDVLEGNVDLMDRAGELLAAMPVRSLDVEVTGDGDRLRVEIDATNVDWVAVHVDGRPRASVDVIGGPQSVVIDDVAGARKVRVEGFAGGAVVVCSIVQVAPGTVAGPLGAVQTSRSRLVGAGVSSADVTVVYVHGAGNQSPATDLKRSWDRDLFDRDLGERSMMAHYADLLHGASRTTVEDDRGLAEAVDAVTGELGSDLTTMTGSDRRAEARDLLSRLTPKGCELALSLSLSVAARSVVTPPAPLDPADELSGLLPVPQPVRILLLRQLLRRLIPDADAYFFTDRKELIRERLRQAIDAVDGPLVIVGHSLGTVVAYDVLSEARFAGRDVRALFTLGSPLGYTEIQDVVVTPLHVPTPVQQWINVADRLDVVSLDTGLANDFDGAVRIVDVSVDNTSPNSHAAYGYLRTHAVRSRIAALVVVA